MMRLAAFVLPFAMAASAAAADRPGLLASYRDSQRTVRAEVPNARFYLDADESLHPTLEQSFEATWVGQLSILQNGEYAFDAGDAEIEVGGQLVGDEPVRLSGGALPLEVRYRRRPGDARLVLTWKGPSFDWEPIPNRLLSHAEEPSEHEKLVAAGRRLAIELGCVNCHASSSRSLEPRLAPELNGIGARRNEGWLFAWMSDPSSVRSDAAMPLMLSAAERQDVARYLAGLDGPAAPELSSKMPSRYREFGATLFQTRGCVACHHREGISLAGAGSKMPFGELVAYLKDPALHDPGGRMPALALDHEEALSVTAHLDEIYSDANYAGSSEGGDAVRGKALVSVAGCLNCHALDLESNFEQPAPFAELSAQQGCLAEDVTGRAPRYRLQAGERAALNAFVEEYAAHPDISRAPIFDHANRLERLRCNACHELNGQAATAPIAEVAPTLTGVGEKLTSGWLRQVLTGGPRSFELADLRMPDYHPREAARLVEGFAKSAGLPPGPSPSQPRTIPAAAGHGMLGTNSQKGGMACIGCHGWGEFEPLGEHGPQLLSAGQRLRYDWFSRWMRNPARILSGTSMPNYFGSLPKAEASEKIDTLWAALSDAEPDHAPEGYVTAEAQLGSEEMPVPTDRPIVIRWDMPGTSPASISVGLPGGLSYCFDAGQVKLLYAWQGGFVDMSPTLTTKKNRETNRTETARYLGDIFYRSEGYPLRVGELGRIPQKRFRGYRLVDGLPKFHYQLDGVDVYELLTARDGKLIRQFEFPKVDQPMWFVEGAQNRAIAKGTDRKLEVEVGP
jgi:mono/diheme cytochrome c family protein